MVMNSLQRDFSNGWNARAQEFIANRSMQIGVATMANWSRSLRAGQSILDIGCGFGGPYTQSLIDAGLTVHGIDPSAVLLTEYQRRFPSVSAGCEAIENTRFLDSRFDAILAIGVVFLLEPEVQRIALERMATRLNAGGRLLFTSPWQCCEWQDLLTDRPSRSLGREQYVAALQAHEMRLFAEYTDEGGNHYYDFRFSTSF
jgi:cyclopropane fatty-acyl-phospholipid synthase-like methyltransferase